MKMINIKNIILFFFLLLFANQFFCVLTKAQNLNSFEQIDTLRLCDSTESNLFILNINTNEINTQEGADLVTNIEIHNFLDDSLIQKFSDTSNSGIMSGEIEYVDINSDGCKDIDIHTGGYNLVPTHSFWLFNKLNNRFYYSPEFSQLNEFSIVFGKKEIESYSQSTGGRGGSSEKYKIENGSLSLMETEYSNYYDYERQEVINGVLRTVELEKEEWIKDDEDNHMSVIKIYNLVNDSLLLTERNWLTGVNMPYSSDIYDNDDL